MFCPECGKEVPEGAVFCPACGRYLTSGYTFCSDSTPVSAQSSTYTYEPSYGQPTKPGYRGVSWLLVIAVVAVAAMVIFTPYLNLGQKGELYGHSFSEEYTGTYTSAEYKIEFTWTYLDGSFSFDMPVEKTDYAFWHSTNTSGRSVVDWSTCTDFVITDTYTASIVSNLSALYEKAFGKAPSADQHYAEFILAYVQAAYAYGTDSLIYGQSEYYAYPVETIVNQKGDCEDTSILCAALYKQAGYDSALLIVPEHAMAGVALENYNAPKTGSGEIISETINGKTYYACETTTESYQPVGVNYSTHDGHLLSYYLNRGRVGQGLYTFYEVG